MARGGPSKRPPTPSSESDYTSSSEDIEEDESGTELTPALDAAILQTLGKIRRGEGVHGSENVLQEALLEAERKAGGRNLTRSTRTAEKPFLLADHHRATLLSGQLHDDAEGYDDSIPLTNVQTERLLRKDAINAFHSLAEEDGSEGDDEDDEAEADEESGFVLKKRKKEVKEAEQEDEEYRKFLLEMGGGEEEVRKILGMGVQPVWRAEEEGEEEEEASVPDASTVAKKDKKKKKDKALGLNTNRAAEKQVKADDDFLMNYILNRGWIDRSEKHVPTYDEIVVDDGQTDVKHEDEEEGEGSHPWGVLEEDDFDEKAEEFETAYNFRYEEPGATDILTHPRIIPSLVRRPDDTRKTKRQAREERKAAERAALEEETRRLKGKKRREMESQLEALKQELGDSIDVDALEKVLEGDWDENEWDRLVGGMLEKAAEEEDQGRPTWDDMDDMDYGEDGDEGDYGEFEDVERAEGEQDYEEVKYEDGPIHMDADFIDEKPIKKSKKDKKGKGRAASPEVDQGLSVAERAERVKQAMDEYKALDHEDMIGDLPTRFHYTQSSQVHLGLTPAEILLATDAELNELAGVKYIAPYRKGGLGKANAGLSKRVRDLKAQLRSRRWGEEGEREDDTQAQQKSRVKVKGTGSNTLGTGGSKRKWGDGAGQVKQEGQHDGQDGERKDGKKVKRLGKKQRMRARLAAEQAGGAPMGGENGKPKEQAQSPAQSVAPPVEVQAKNGDGATAEGEGKKRRKKSKKGEKLLQMYE